MCVCLYIWRKSFYLNYYFQYMFYSLCLLQVDFFRAFTLFFNWFCAYLSNSFLLSTAFGNIHGWDFQNTSATLPMEHLWRLTTLRPFNELLLSALNDIKTRTLFLDGFLQTESINICICWIIYLAKNVSWTGDFMKHLITSLHTHFSS